MKKALCILAVILFAPLLVRADGLVGFGVHANYATLDVASANFAGTLKNVYGGGWGAGAHVDFSLIILGGRASVDYMHFSADADEYRKAVSSVIPGSNPAEFDVSGGGVTIWSGTVNGKLPFAIPVVSPYLTGGVGFASINAEEATVTWKGNRLGSVPEVSSGFKFSANLGAGVDVAIPAVVDLFLEIRYTWVFTDQEKSTYVPIMLGVTF